MTKQNLLDEAFHKFAGSGVNVTTSARPYLGAVIGSREYVEEYVCSKVRAWSSRINIFSDITKSQPQAAFLALTNGLLSHVVPNISHLLVPLDNVLRTNLIPAIIGQNPLKDLEHDLFVLPAWHGGLGIGIPSKNANRELQSSQKVTLSLKNHILDQNR